MDLRVESYAGYRGEQEPRRFHLADRSLEVVDVLDRWAGPDHRYFKVRADDGTTWILRHQEPGGPWQVF